MQEKFIKSSIYVVVGIAAFIFFVTAPYNFFCKSSKLCKPIILSSIVPKPTGKQEISYKFTAETSDQLKSVLEFYPETENEKILNGKKIDNIYHVKNLSDKTVTVKPMYKLSDSRVSEYLERIECLCMKEQILKPGEEADLAVSFRMNPKIEDDLQLKEIKELEIGYQIFLE